MSRAHVRIIETNSHICGMPWLSKIQIFLHCSYGLHSASDSGSQRVLAVGVGFGSGHGFRASKPFTWADEGCISVEAAHVPMQLEESIISPFGKRPVRVLGRRMVSQSVLFKCALWDDAVVAPPSLFTRDAFVSVRAYHWKRAFVCCHSVSAQYRVCVLGRIMVTSGSFKSKQLR